MILLIDSCKPNRSNQKPYIMLKTLLGLAVIGAAATYLYKTEKGAEIRKQAADYADKALQGLREKYGQMAEAGKDQLAAQTA
jgi:hypothetical protein